ncbi:hypothetical protein G7046_g4219 [Stylonectria norvegica]|nr:hypothetical protein G7046_g4219 [Stylonectria norvegica]
MVALTTRKFDQTPFSSDVQVHLFYNTNNNNLALELRSERKAQDGADDDYVATSADQPGNILNASRLASANLTGVGLVFGVTKQKAPASVAKDCDCPPAADTKNDISIVGPIYRTLASTENKNISIAACSSDDTAWVFYLTGTDANTLEIKEVAIGAGTPADYQDTVKIMPGTSLAAYYVPEADERYIIYQANSDSHLREYTIDGGDSLLKNSSDAADKTTLAVVYVNKTAYLYYTDPHHELRKLTKVDGKWGSSSPVKNSHKVDPDSQITVVATEGNNHIFYVASGDASNKFVHLMDKQ